jgi:hypothetical protein
VIYLKSISAVFSAVRMLFNRWSTLPLLITVYAALLLAVYLFVTTREATVPQLALTLAAIVIAPLLFFLLQAASVNYATDSPATSLLKKALRDCLKFLAVSLPVIGLTFLALYGLGKLQGQLSSESRNSLTALTVVRYLLVGVVAPLLTIQLWITTSSRGLRAPLRNLRQIVANAFAPQAVFVFAGGFVLFAVIPYVLLVFDIPTQRAWLEVSLFAVRVTVSALLILLGWVTTVGTLSILSRQSVRSAAQE